MKNRSLVLFWAILPVISFALITCGKKTPSSPGSNPTPTVTSTRTITSTMTLTTTPAPSSTATATTSPTQSPTVTLSATSTSSSTRTPTRTRTETPTLSPTATLTKTHPPSPTGTPTPTSTRTITPTVTPTNTPYGLVPNAVFDLFIAHNCNSCHVASYFAGDISNAPAFASSFIDILANVSCGGMVDRVKSQDPNNSILIDRLEGSVCGPGTRMPPSPVPTMTSAEVQVIKNWITSLP